MLKRLENANQVVLVLGNALAHSEGLECKEGSVINVFSPTRYDQSIMANGPRSHQVIQEELQEKTASRYPDKNGF